MANSKPFDICETCGSPVLHNESLSLVLMFKTRQDRKEFAEIVGRELGLTSYSIDDDSC